MSARQPDLGTTLARINPVYVASLKAYGDLVIARSAIRDCDMGARPVALLLGEHLCELNDVLGPLDRSLVVAHGEAGVPAVFDLRRRGSIAGLRSAWSLRSAMAQLRLPHGATVVFDKHGLRERIVFGNARCARLPPAPGNIYLAYRDVLTRLGCIKGEPAPPPAPRSATGAALVGVFPGSRIAAKNLPPGLVSAIMGHCRALGHRTELFLLRGERTDLEAAFPDATLVPRSFSAMLDAVKSCTAVISADSLPAHLAEFRNVPAFVVSPVPNRYWLPLSCHVAGRWALFSEVTDPGAALSRFLAESRSATG